ncbi:hypothetical protein N7454_007014 [Penicillium verhagenii]|nr:hypothetical protein N7454_007014 [Penicillium verhagenii]
MAPNVEDLRKAAFDAEKDLNSYQAKQGLGKRVIPSGVDEMANKRFADAGASLKYGPGSTASGSDHRKVPEDEGGTRDDRGRLPQAGQFNGSGGPEDNVKIDSENRPGDQDALNLQDMKQRGIAK